MSEEVDKLREGLRALTIALNQRLNNLEIVADEILKRLEEIETLALKSQMAQARFLSDHEHMIEEIERATQKLSRKCQSPDSGEDKQS